MKRFTLRQSAAGSLMLLILILAVPIAKSQFYDLPPLPEPALYGNILIDRQVGEGSFAGVSFSHWSHRRHHTCRVCHFELQFEMKTNATPITEAANQNGEYCGACHNGETAFGHTQEYCTWCHNFGLDGSEERFAETAELPPAPFGNRIDWVGALEAGLIAPRNTIYKEAHQPIEYDVGLDLPADWAMIPGAHFPHEIHIAWLDCAECHPQIFNIKKKTTERFDMKYNLEGRFCGVCHMSVAFPMDDCSACHPSMRYQNKPKD